MPIFNPKINNANAASNIIIPPYSPNNNRGVDDNGNKKLYRPSPVLENLELGLQNRDLETYKSLIPKYYKPKVPQSLTDTQIDGNWTDHAALAAKYSNGIPIYTAVKLNGAIDVNGAQQSYFGEGGKILTDMYLDNAVLTIKQNKSIISTKIMGRNFEIKEYIGMQDYDIKIEGTLVNNYNGIYPIEPAKLLSQYCTLGVSIYVTNPYLNTLFNIDYLTVKSFDISQEKGGISYQKFTIDCVNDDLSYSDIVKSVYNS